MVSSYWPILRFSGVSKLTGSRFIRYMFQIMNIMNLCSMIIDYNIEQKLKNSTGNLLKSPISIRKCELRFFLLVSKKKTFHLRCVPFIFFVRVFLWGNTLQ